MYAHLPRSTQASGQKHSFHTSWIRPRACTEKERFRNTAKSLCEENLVIIRFSGERLVRERIDKDLRVSTLCQTALGPCQKRLLYEALGYKQTTL